MLLTKIIAGVNKLVGNNSSMRLRYRDLELYLDSSIDIINTTLRPEEEFKTISELYEPDEDYDGEFEYKEFSDKYIRLVLIYLTAALYLEEEDETEDQYQIYRARANTALEQWKQDEYSDYDIVDNSYPYENTQQLKEFEHNVITLEKETKRLEPRIKALIEE